MKRVFALLCGVVLCLPLLTACADAEPTPNTPIASDPATTTTTTTTVAATTTTTTQQENAPWSKISLCFDGQEYTLEYYKTKVDENTGHKLRKYYKGTEFLVSPYCVVDTQTGRVIKIYNGDKLSSNERMSEEDARSYFLKRFGESNLSSTYLNKIEITVSDCLPTAAVTLVLNDAGDTVKWGLSQKCGRIWIASISVELADPDVYPKELEDFYRLTPIE